MVFELAIEHLIFGVLEYLIYILLLIILVLLLNEELFVEFVCEFHRYDIIQIESMLGADHMLGTHLKHLIPELFRLTCSYENKIE